MYETIDKNEPLMLEVLEGELDDGEMMNEVMAMKQFFEWGNLSAENLTWLRAIQTIMLFEEGKKTLIDDVLTRIL